MNGGRGDGGEACCESLDNTYRSSMTTGNLSLQCWISFFLILLELSHVRAFSDFSSFLECSIIQKKQ